MKNSKKHVFIIDDNTNFIELQRELLAEQDRDIEVFYALNGKEGLEKVIASSPMPDIIFLDLMLPDISGAEVLKQLKNSPAKDVPVIVITAFQEQELLNECKSLGAADVIIKPPHFGEFAETMLNLINKYIPV